MAHMDRPEIRIDAWDARENGYIVWSSWDGNVRFTDPSYLIRYVVDLLASPDFLGRPGEIGTRPVPYKRGEWS